MPFIPLYGHQSLRDRLAEAARRGTLPQSLLLHGARGVGKQRLALWLAQLLLCEREQRPCGECRHCRYVLDSTHPDLVWIFPRTRPKDGEPDMDDVRTDLLEAAHERAEEHGLYAAPSGSEGIFVAMSRWLVQRASITPALAKRKVFIVGDADRMVPQEGAEAAANAFLKLLEEPPENTFLILTTSALGALLPTIRSRVVALRVPAMPDRDVRTFLQDEHVRAALRERTLPADVDQLVTLAAGSPGRLLSAGTKNEAMEDGRRFIDAATAGDRAGIMKTAFSQGNSGARGDFFDMLDAVTVHLHARVQDAAQRKDERFALAASRAISLVEEAKLMAGGNVNPSLISARLLQDLAAALR
jgi:DNA polymerase III subunit delta'